VLDDTDEGSTLRGGTSTRMQIIVMPSLMLEQRLGNIINYAYRAFRLYEKTFRRLLRVSR